MERTTVTTTHNKAIEARRSWKKFGNLVEANVEHYHGIVFERPIVGKASKGTSEHKDIVKCYNCGGNHHTLKCPNPIKAKEVGVITGFGAATVDTAAAASGSKAGTYKVVRTAGGRQPHEDDNRKVRVTNLSEDCNGDALKRLFARQGLIERFFLMRDKATGACKGVAFISYFNRKDALKACMNLDKFGFEHMVISVEMADGTAPTSK